MTFDPTQLRILIADDDPADAIRLEGFLNDAGYTHVRTTTDLGEVVGLHAKWPFDLLLVDIVGLDGDHNIVPELAAQAADGFDVPVILALLDDSGRESQERAIIAGARDFLIRPFNRPEVMNRVRNMLDLKGRHITGTTSRIFKTA